MPWKERDSYSKIVGQYRLAVRNGVIANQSRLSGNIANRLKRVTERIGVEFFLPLVYRIEIDLIAHGRRSVAGSGLAGSREYLIVDLRETEFDLLFSEDVQGDLAALLSGTLSANDALQLLERRR